MTKHNSLDKIPVPGDIVKKVESYGAESIIITFENGKEISVPTDFSKNSPEEPPAFCGDRP